MEKTAPVYFNIFNMSIVVFEVKKGSPTSWTLRQRDVMAEKPGTGELKYIGYYRGHNSIFTEDINNKDVKPSKVPAFILNPTRNKCELRFDDRDKALFKYVTSHPDYPKKYVMYSIDIESQEKLSKSEAIEKALDYIKESDGMKIRALGLAVLGMSSYGKSLITTKADLKEKAINKPQEVIKACEDPLFENKFVASMAICSGIVKTNSTMTAIIWADNNGRILNIATGEDFVTKLAKHISNNTPESQSLLQEMGKRLELTKKEKTEKSKDAIIAELREELAKKSNGSEPKEQTEKASNIEVKEPEEVDIKKLAILEVRARYKEVMQKNIPFQYQNNMEWMQKKINEKEQELV